MEKQANLRLWLEIVWWILTAVVVAAVLYPIHQATANYPFYGWNIGFIVGAITLARYIFLIKHTFIAKKQRLKIALTVACMPLIIVAIGGLNHFMTWIAENDWTPITGHLPYEKALPLQLFVWNEMLFFAVGTIVGGGALLVRLVISLWRTHNLDES